MPNRHSWEVGQPPNRHCCDVLHRKASHLLIPRTPTISLEVIHRKALLIPLEESTAAWQRNRRLDSTSWDAAWRCLCVGINMEIRKEDKESIRVQPIFVRFRDLISSPSSFELDLEILLRNWCKFFVQPHWEEGVGNSVFLDSIRFKL